MTSCHAHSAARTLCKTIAAAGALALARGASASLIIDVRAVSGTGGINVAHAKEADLLFAVPGATLSLNVYAMVTGQNGFPFDEGILSFAGSFLTPPNGLARGNLVASRASSMTGTGGSNGLVQDLDGDGDLDVGSNNNGSAANFFSARATAAPTPVFGQETLVATLTFTLAQLGSDGAINFRPRVSSTAASWFEDGSQITSSNFTAGTPVILFWSPEPGAAVLSTIWMGATLLTRRRSALSSGPA